MIKEVHMTCQLDYNTSETLCVRKGNKIQVIILFKADLWKNRSLKRILSMNQLIQFTKQSWMIYSQMIQSEIVYNPLEWRIFSEQQIKLKLSHDFRLGISSANLIIYFYGASGPFFGHY